MKTQTYTKINTLYKRFKNLNKVELPNPAWKAFQNKIMLGNFSDDHMEYIRNLKFDCFSKIDGTNTKIAFLPSTGECIYGGKTDNADLGQHNKIMPEIVERIAPKLREMFPPETAKFIPVMNDKQQIQYRWPEGGEKIAEVTAEDIRDYGTMWAVDLEEVPVYIYGELYGPGVQKGGHYGDTLRFAVFDICQQGWFLPIGLLTEMCNNLGLDMVPYIGQMTIREAENMVQKGFKTMVWEAKDPDYIEEGIVARPVVPIKDPRGKRIIVKIKYCDYHELDEAIKKVGNAEYIRFYKWYKENQEMIENIE